jgi:hypothetical protein
VYVGGLMIDSVSLEVVHEKQNMVSLLTELEILQSNLYTEEFGQNHGRVKISGHSG